MSEWKTHKLSELVEIKYGKDHKHLTDGAIPVYGSGGIMRFADTFLYDKPSILIPRKGTLSNLFYIDIPFWSVDTMFYTRIKEGNNGKYLYYLLKSKDLASMNVGSAVPSLTTEVLNKVEITIPDLPTQKQIAQILTSLDDKIQLNLQMNQTLDAMVQALFKEWFLNLKFPNFDGELENGLPKGWRKGKLSDLCIKITKGTTPTTLKKQFTNEGINFIKVESINEVNGFIPEKFAFIDKETNELLKRSKIEKNDILFTIAGTLGRIAIVDVSILPANTNQAVAIIRCSSPDYINYVLFLLKSELFLNTITSKAVHAVQANISLGVISDTEVVIPTTEILFEFNETINPIIEKMIENNYQIQTLTQIRDALLPKLMSGKIEVK